MRNLKPYRFPQQSAIAKHLADLAAQELTITYRDLAIIFGMDTTGLCDPGHELHQVLQSIQIIDKAAGRPSRTVVVISLKSRMPGNGFFRLYGIGSGDARVAFYAEHRSAAKQYYSWVMYCEVRHHELPATMYPTVEGPAYVGLHTASLGYEGVGRLPN